MTEGCKSTDLQSYRLNINSSRMLFFGGERRQLVTKKKKVRVLEPGLGTARRRFVRRWTKWPTQLRTEQYYTMIYSDLTDMPLTFYCPGEI
jgi:hypothetical protein